MQIRHDIVHEIDDDSALLRYRAPASACRLGHLGLLEHAWVSIDQKWARTLRAGPAGRRLARERLPEVRQFGWKKASKSAG